jgi:glutamine amidotransferase
MLVAIIDYGSGNLRSAAKAFEVAAAKTGHKVIVTNDPAALADASHIVLPGVGAFADCMHGLEAVSGMRRAMDKQVMEHKKPFLGICVGMQMLFDTGHEYGTHKGLGWIAGEVRLMEPPSNDFKVPHMGWNELTVNLPQHPLLAEIHTGDHAYFVHSYHGICKDAADVLATTEYHMALTAVVAKGNITGTQFHPEKSQQTGLRLIENFLKL